MSHNGPQRALVGARCHMHIIFHVLNFQTISSTDGMRAALADAVLGDYDELGEGLPLPCVCFAIS